jgi:hypothetical protein
MLKLLLLGAFLASFSIGVNVGVFLAALIVYLCQRLQGQWSYLCVHFSTDFFSY